MSRLVIQFNLSILMDLIVSHKPHVSKNWRLIITEDEIVLLRENQ